MNSTNSSRVIVALDFPDGEAALAFAQRVTPQSCRLKVGKELFTACGPALVETLVVRGFDIFLDLKYHDIPNTVAGACKSAARLGVWMMNVHALGGRAMMQAAREALGEGGPKLIAVTVLTSMAARDLIEVGITESPDATVLKLAALTKQCGLDGVVCSAQEAQQLKQACGNDFELITPGIRFSDAKGDDQQRVMTPQAAFAAGADYLVMGRPITQAQDPLAVLETVNRIAAQTATNTVKSA